MLTARMKKSAGAYRELDHPADLFLEIRAAELPGLYANALFAFYDHVAELGDFQPREERILAVEAPRREDVLRRLLTEALYYFETEHFVGTEGQVQVEETSEEPGRMKVTAVLRGERVDKTRHRLQTEIKAVTYHLLSVEQLADGTWKATVLFDV